MSAPTESGWYWAKYKGNWMVVYYSENCSIIFCFGTLWHFRPDDFEEWGERVERKEEGK